MRELKISKKADGKYQVTNTETIEDVTMLFRMRDRLRRDILNAEKQLGHMKETLANLERICAGIDQEKNK